MISASFRVTKKELMLLMDDWLDEIDTLKIEIHPLDLDEFLVYRHLYEIRSHGRIHRPSLESITKEDAE